jgi:DNA-binding NtrC family response regulator
MLTRVVLAISSAALRRRLSGLLRDADDTVVEALTARGHLWERAARKNCDVLVVGEAAIPQPVEASVRLVHDTPSAPAVVVISDKEDATHHAALAAAGCDEVFYAGVPADTLAAALKAVLERRRAQAGQSVDLLRVPAQPRLTDFISESPTMRAFMGTVQRLLQSDTSLLILGETGVGKERLARAIHAEGPRSSGPFVAVNCGALPEALLESELFGHEEGAFTGATRSRRGAFELAHSGVIFLDEVGDMPLHLQVKLLRVLQEHEVRRVGAENGFAVDLRVMAASNRDLEAEVEAGRFRRDLYYRLSVVTLAIPPLRDRREDIVPLAESYVDYLRPRIGSDVSGMGAEALAAMEEYDWPGNVRELINVVERAMLLCEGGQIGCGDLPVAIAKNTAVPAAARSRGDAAALAGLSPELLRRPLREVRAEIVERFERAYITAMLRETGGRVGETAQRAGIEARSLYDKMNQYGFRKENFRPSRRKP